jgi:spermidine synthase
MPTKRSLYFEIFLIALAVIVLEVSYTRVFSYKLVYYFTYLVIGVSLLGLGAGGVFVSLFESLRRIPPRRLILICSLVASLSVTIGYFITALLPMNLFQMVIHLGEGRWDTVILEMAKLAILLVTLFIPFAAAGVALAIIFATRTENISRLYFADLSGAALGCTMIIPIMIYLSPPGGVLLAALCFAISVWNLARDEGRSWVVGVAGSAALALLFVIAPGLLPDPVKDNIKGDSDAEAIFSRWSPVFRVDVVPIPLPGAAPSNFLVHDGTLGSVLYSWDGKKESLGRYDTLDRQYPFRLLGPGADVAIVGSAGGNEVMASLHFEANHVTGIELNPVTVDLLHNEFADFTGRLVEHPKVEIVNAEGRAFLEGSGQNFDLIWLVAPDSYAAMNAASSGAFVLSESYLYTREMIQASVEHLTADGILCAQFGEIGFGKRPNRTLRYLATAREAFRELGITDFPAHVMVTASPGFSDMATVTILLKKSAFTPADIATLEKTAASLDGNQVIYTPGMQNGTHPAASVIAAEGEDREAFYANYPYQIGPITDDSPFFWHFVSFPDALTGRTQTSALNIEEGVGEKAQIALLFAAIVLAATFLLAPLVFLRDVWRQIEWKGSAGIYFMALGLGFMFIEVCLIQQLTLFLGYPTYSLTVTLFSLLLSTGLGSLLSERYRTRRNQAFGFLAISLIALVTFYQFALSPIIEAAVAAPLGLRVLISVLMLTPLGLCLGMFMPLGLATVSSLGEFGEQYVAWCWAVNGFFSVVASVLATVLSMTIGFQAVMLVGLVIYLIGISVFSRVPQPGA